MSWKDNKVRCQKIYFGKSNDDKPLKEDVARFIRIEMGEVYDGGPAWSDGVPKLVEIGMRYWDQQLGKKTLEELDELRSDRDRLKRENRYLRKQLSDQRKQVTSERATDRLEQIEAGILRVLCQEKELQKESSSFVPTPTIVQQTGLDYDTVVHYLENLSRTEFGGYVEYDDAADEARASRVSAFEEYCKCARLNESQVALVDTT